MMAPVRCCWLPGNAVAAPRAEAESARGCAAAAGVAPRIMGMGPVRQRARCWRLAGLTIGDMDVIELNEAFASQALAVLRDLGIPDDAPHVNPNGGAIALGHPLGASGARLVTAAVLQLQRTGGRYASVHDVHRRWARDRDDSGKGLVAKGRRDGTAATLARTILLNKKKGGPEVGPPE